MGQVNGGELVVRTLVEAGVTDAFAIHGGHLESIFQACLDHGVRVVNHRDEAAAGHAAEGYARARRTLGVAMATAGPGTTNIITSIANAFSDRTPVVYITGSAPQIMEDLNQSQAGIDNVALARPVTKWARRITLASDIPRLVSLAIRIATSAPTGPVLLDLPFDVSLAAVDEDTTPIPVSIGAAPPTAPQPEVIAEILALLAGAERPVIMAGRGAWQSGSEVELRAFAEATGIPVFAHYQSQGLLPSDHPLYGGTFYRMTDLSEPEHRPDVVLALGTRFGVYTLHPSSHVVPVEAKVIHVEVDATEIGRIQPVDVPVVADSRETLRELNKALGQSNWPKHREWQQTVAYARAGHQQQMDALLKGSDAPIHPYQVASIIVESIDDDAILIGDGAEAHQWLVEAARPARPGQYFTHGHFACLGMGLGLSIGAQVANPGRRVLLATGDGAVGFTIAEFDTMVRHGLPIVVVVLNNQMWGATRHFQEIISGPDRLIGTDLHPTRYDLVAAGFGCHGEQVSRLDELGPAIERSLASGLPACINVATQFAEMPPDGLLLLSAM